MSVDTRAASKLPVTAILSACLFLIGTAAAAVAPYRALVAIDGLGLSNGIYAIIMTVSSIGTAVASLVLGYVSDKVTDRRVLVVVCGLIGTIAYAVIYLVPTVLSYVIAFCVILPFGGALFSQTFSYSRSYYDERNRERSEFMMSALRSLYAMAWVVAPPIVGWIASSYSIFGVFAVAGLAQGLCTVIFGLLFVDPSAKIGVSSKKAASNVPPPRIEAFRIVGISGVTLLRIAVMLHLTALPLVLSHDFSATLGEVGVNASLAALLEVPLMLAWGWAASRWPKDMILALNGLIYALYMLLVVTVARSVLDVLLLQGINAIATAALVSLNISYVQEAIKGRVGLSTSLIDVMTVIAGFVSAAAFAALASPTSYAGVMLAGAALSAGGAVILGASILMRRAMPADKL